MKLYTVHIPNWKLKPFNWYKKTTAVQICLEFKSNTYFFPGVTQFLNGLPLSVTLTPAAFR